MIDEGKKKDNSIQNKPEKKVSFVLPIIVAAAIFVVMVVAIVGSVLWRDITIENDDFTRCYQIDNIVIEDDILTVNGWCFVYGVDCTLSNDESVTEIALCELNNENSKLIIMDTQCGIEREDVNDYFYCEFDYTNCGFKANKNCVDLDLDNKDYQILIEYANKKNVFYKTDAYICDGKLISTTPYAKILEDSIGNDLDSDLEVVVKDGFLRVYRPDKGMYVYQYQNNLYWFADKNFKWEDDCSTEIQYQLTTTQVDKIPQKMKDVGAVGDNLSFAFEDYELTETSNTGKFRVSTYALPKEYSVKHIVTGYHNGTEWEWQQYFRPRYEF